MMLDLILELFTTLVYLVGLASAASLVMAWHLYTKLTTHSNLCAVALSTKVDHDSFPFRLPSPAKALQYKAKVMSGLKAKVLRCPMRPVFEQMPLGDSFPPTFVKTH